MQTRGEARNTSYLQRYRRCRGEKGFFDGRIHPGQVYHGNCPINPLNVEVVVPVRRHGSIHKGMTAEVRPESPVGGVYRGKVVIVDMGIDAASGTYRVRVELSDANLKLPAGLKCKVRFIKKQYCIFLITSSIRLTNKN